MGHVMLQLCGTKKDYFLGVVESFGVSRFILAALCSIHLFVFLDQNYTNEVWHTIGAIEDYLAFVSWKYARRHGENVHRSSLEEHLMKCVTCCVAFLVGGV